MMTTMAQTHSPYPVGMQQHAGVPPHMVGVPQHPQQGQPTSGMPPQMHMAASGPGGPQMSHPGAMMGGMPSGMNGPNTHAMQHISPQQQAYLQQQQRLACEYGPA